MTGRLAIFDCDGTLVDGYANIARAMEMCFTDAALDPPHPGATRRIVGLSVIEAMQVLVPDGPADLHAGLAERYKKAFQRLRAGNFADEALYDGVLALLHALEADGWLLGIATGKSDRGLGLFLDAHGLRPRFVSLQTSDRHPSKPHPSMIEQAMAEAGTQPHATMMIGDTSYDMAMARAAGVTAVGVAWGYHDAAELHAAGAHFVAGHPLEILDFARAWA